MQFSMDERQMNDHDLANILMVDDQPGKLMSYEVILEELGENSDSGPLGQGGAGSTPAA